MKVFTTIDEFTSKTKTIITIGTFDGVHIGHQTILKKITNQAHLSDLESTVLTFFPHPRMVLQKDSGIKLLNTIKEKTFLLKKTGVNSLIVHPFDKNFSRLSAEEFVKEILVDKLNIAKIVIGHDHRFGRNRNATISDLITFGEKFDFEVEQISAKDIDNITVSSTKIRNALEMGDVVLAKNYLGQNYFLTGTVIEGKKIGRTIGFPTANIKIDEDYKLIPKIGSYIVSTIINFKLIYGMMNIGYNPTFSNHELSLEIYFFNFNKSIYSETIQINFINRIRDEKKFNSLEDLKNQLKKDKIYALNYLKNNT